MSVGEPVLAAGDHYLRRLVMALAEEGASADLASIPESPSVGLVDHELERDDLALVGRLRDRLVHLEQREHELSALYETVQDLASLRDVEQMLLAIVRRARRLMNTDLAYLSAYDPDRGDFYVRATVGSVSERFQRIRVARDVGVCGLVAREKRPYYSSDYMNDTRFAHEASIDRGVDEEEVVSLLGVPLLVDEQVIGVLFVADRYTRVYSPPQITLLNSLATHAAVAIESARLFEATERSLARERETNLRLQEQTREVEAAAEAHDQLASLIARGGGLQELCEVVSRELSGEVAIFDAGLRAILACHGDEMRKTVQGCASELHGALDESHRRGHSVVRAAIPGYRVAAVVGGGSLQGGIALKAEHPLTPARIRTLERSAVIAALVLLSEERVRAVEHRAMADLVSDLVTARNRDATQLARDAERRGVDFAQTVTVMAVDAPQISFQAVVDLVRQVFPAGVLVAPQDSVIVILVTTSDPAHACAAVQSALQRRSPSKVTIAYALPVTSPASVPQASLSALRCLRTLITLGRAGDITSEDALGPYPLLFSDHGRASINAFVTGAIGPLVEHDEQRDSQLARTLLHYLDLGRDAKAAAERLYIHPNTMRQRLRTIGRILPGWDEPERRLEVHLALRLALLANSE